MTTPDVREALRELLAAYEAWASASLIADVAKKNFTDPQSEIDAECAALERCSNAEKAARAALAAADAAKAPATFYWLVELFNRGENAPSLGRYHTGFTDLRDASRSTTDVHEARRYRSREAAQRTADKLNVMMKAAEWRAIEHGFHTAPPNAAAQEPKP